jgi:hypothetical protein
MEPGFSDSRRDPKSKFLSFFEKKIRAKLIKSTFSWRTRKARAAIAGSFYHFSAIFRPQALLIRQSETAAIIRQRTRIRHDGASPA